MEMQAHAPCRGCWILPVTVKAEKDKGFGWWNSESEGKGQCKCLPVNGKSKHTRSMEASYAVLHQTPINHRPVFLPSRMFNTSAELETPSPECTYTWRGRLSSTLLFRSLQTKRCKKLPNCHSVSRKHAICSCSVPAPAQNQRKAQEMLLFSKLRSAAVLLSPGSFPESPQASIIGKTEQNQPNPGNISWADNSDWEEMHATSRVSKCHHVPGKIITGQPFHP